MKFRYKKYGIDLLRPVIPIEIVFSQGVLPYEVLVDSGADVCIFDAEVAPILGINLFQGEKRKLQGVTGIPSGYYVHNVQIKVGGWPYFTEVGFLPDMPDMGYGIVGQKGFFDIFTVRFDLLKEEIELRERK